ncbi:ABC transporter transmembrane domain-containing protein [Paenibacillus sp. CAU 1782]
MFSLSLVRSIASQFWKYKALSSLFLLALLLEVAYGIAAPYSLKFLVDEAFTPKNVEMFLLILGLLLAGGLFSVFANVLGDYALGKLGGKSVRDLRLGLFSHLQKQSLPFFQNYKIGDLITRFSSDMSSIDGVIRVTSPFFLRETLSVVMGLTMLFLLEWKLTLAVMAGSVLMIAGPRLLQKRAESANMAYKEAQAHFSNTVDELIKGYKTIKSLHLRNRILLQGRKRILELFNTGFRLHMTNALMERFPMTGLLVLNGTMIGFGGYLIFQDQMSIGEFIAFLTLFMSVGQSGANLTYLMPALIESHISFKRIAEIMEQKPSVPEAENARELPAAISRISFNDVTFGYTEQSDQLRRVNLEIPVGSYTAFVGTSGSGKSTALQLLARFYDPRQGSIKFDQLDLKEITESSLRSYAALVTQETFLFNTTIRDNLGPEPDSAISDVEMVETAKKAQIHETIVSWPDGYDTEIHHEGGTLSGGERQRLSIARALLRKPKLLLLDEVTAALDPVTEAEINALLLQLRGKQTLVSVTHRLASIEHADCIHVFHNGTIEESGTHQELMLLGGRYKSLWDKQHGLHLSPDGSSASVDAARLAELGFFAGIELGLLEEIARSFATETFNEGDTVVREGQQGDKFYLIVRGKFDILKESGDGEKIRLATLLDGDHFGEIALLRNIPRTATVMAAAPSVLLSIRREAFNRLISAQPQIRTMLEQSLEKRS